MLQDFRYNKLELNDERINALLFERNYICIPPNIELLLETNTISKEEYAELILMITKYQKGFEVKTENDRVAAQFLLLTNQLDLYIGTFLKSKNAKKKTSGKSGGAIDWDAL